MDKTAKMLMVFEENGDFINTYLAPPLVTAQEIFNEINNYLILDVRNSDLFAEGHIENSINISIHNLYNFINNQTDSVNTSIVLVSKNGQASAYYATLLRLAGFDNIFSLKFGMASWNFDFAEEWLDAVGNDIAVMGYTNNVFPRNEFVDFPTLEEFNSNMSIPEIIETRIQMLISNGFYSDETHIRNMPIGNDENYIVCYGNSSLYLSPEFEGIGFGHPVSAVSYRDDPWYELRSFKYLQTLPSNKDIIVYSYNGQLSACIVAYLNVLGYSAKSLLFGANQLFHTRMLDSVALNEFAFTFSEIMNYDYVTGE
ncbi:rhodanese-like domain-containing protein [Bacteroidota bacterium]